ncbi:auxin-responsive protein SAUR50-like [Tripterygium wilfordii]|uniref:auxin-responsive protein SAUR50-like n=1 Tax=Tripterygium wilfordii TaxID=458696 RepID=UPI0018F7F21A|nr:auxin-responsive protein SAUR50-like [Tripterygium wilfordii]
MQNMAKKQGNGTKVAPKGHFVVYVGDELKRFVVPLSHLKSPTFKKLLERAAEEFGFSNHGRIVLPCDEAAFYIMVSDIAENEGA